MDSLNTPRKIESQQEKAPERVAGFEVAEKKVETSKSEDEKQLLKKSQPLKTDKSQPSVGAPGIDSQGSPLHQIVEAILEKDLEDLYLQMDETAQEKFKNKGEETATEIIKLINQTKATFKRVFTLIKAWLKVIPGVSKFFIEQDAKIKADRILEIEKK